MSTPPELATLVREWLAKAANDLKNAEHTLQIPDDECPFDTVAFHAQQCAEKSLKALLAYHRVDFQKIHDVGQLLHLCTMAPALVRELDAIDRLNPYAVEARYPGGWEPIHRAEAQDAAALARKVYEAVRRQLAPHGF